MKYANKTFSMILLFFLVGFSPVMPMFDDIEDINDLDMALDNFPLIDWNVFNSIDSDSLNDNEISLNSIQYQQPNTTMTAPMKYTCRKWCKEKFPTVNDRKRHEDFLCIDMDFKTNPKNEACLFCGRWYASSQILRHQNGSACKDYTLKNSYQCELCLKRFPEDSLLIEHRNGCKRSEDGYRCQWCDKNFSTLLDQKGHEHWQCIRPLHKDLRQCNNCQQWHWRGTENHSKKLCEKILSENRYQCDLCKRRFPSQEILNYHQQVHVQNDLENSQNELDLIHSGDNNDHEIVLDSLQYQQPNITMTEPIGGLRPQTIKPNLPKEPCLFCGEWHLTTKMQWHQAGSACKGTRLNNPYQCELCLKRFSRESLLLEHKNACKQPEKVYHCEKWCDKAFSTLLEQKKHEHWQCVRPLHKNLRQCNNCQEIHCQGSQNHPKSSCDKFLSKNKYQCDLCKRRFPSQGVLDYHQQIHVQNNQSQILQNEQRHQNQPEQMELSNFEVSQKEVFEEIIEEMEESDHTSYPLLSEDDYWGDTYEVYQPQEYIESSFVIPQNKPPKQRTINDVEPQPKCLDKKSPEKEIAVSAIMPLVNQLKEKRHIKNQLFWINKIRPTAPKNLQRFNDQALEDARLLNSVDPVQLGDEVQSVTLPLIVNALKAKKDIRTIMFDKVQICEQENQKKRMHEFSEDDTRFLQSGATLDWSDDEGLSITGGEKTMYQFLPQQLEPQAKKQKPLFVMPKILPKTQEPKPLVFMGSKLNDNNQRIVLPRSMPNLTMHSVNDTMCDRCGRWYSSEHLKKECTQYILHNSYQCKLCKERFPSSTRLEVHQKMCKPQPQINHSSNVLVQPSRHSFQQYVVNIPQNSFHQVPQIVPSPSIAQKRQLEEKQGSVQKKTKK